MEKREKIEPKIVSEVLRRVEKKIIFRDKGEEIIWFLE
jgi:hypothetical protein